MLRKNIVHLYTFLELWKSHSSPVFVTQAPAKPRHAVETTPLKEGVPFTKWPAGGGGGGTPPLPLPTRLSHERGQCAASNWKPVSVLFSPEDMTSTVSWNAHTAEAPGGAYCPTHLINPCGFALERRWWQTFQPWMVNFSGPLFKIAGVLFQEFHLDGLAG